jgi:hypothetical protein
MTTYYKAAFSNGKTLMRSTAGRKYSHCYLVECTYQYADWQDEKKMKTAHSIRSGWAARPDLADKAMRGAMYGTIDFNEIAPAVEITGQEYRALKKVAK